MGRFSRKRKNFNQGGDNAAKKQNNGYDKNWKKTEPKSERFEAYYKSQNIIPENEWDDFLGALKKHLPVTFRITDGSFNIFAEEIKMQLEKHFTKGEQIVKVDDQDITVEPPTPISWYPNKGAWRFNVGRTVLRKVPELESFHKFIIYQTEMGNMTRQEEVSMVPPFFLNIEPHHHVLDMCAAPGSKTIQLTEMLHSKDKDDKPPSGIIIANDVDQGRCYMLTHQVKRLGSPCVFITNHEAQAYPILKVITKNEENKEVKVLYQFDRILCDVPCSGDGTLRKNMELWKRWHSGMGVGLHRLQLKISSKGVELLKVGGRMVYSTCSFNPIEDEAIVCQLLRKYKGKIRLVDVSNEYPLMKRRPGLTTWKIQDKDGTVYKDFDHVCSIPKKSKVFVRSLFPPSEEEVKEFHLERCMRFFPHLGDTGGFFVTVIEKIASTAPVGNDQKAEEEKKKEEEEEKEEKEILSELQSEVPELSTEIGAAESNSFGGKKKRGKGEDPFLPFPPEMKATWDEIKNFYGITDSFPVSQLMIRSEQSKKIYFISPGSLELFKTDQKGSLTIVNAGVKIFARADQKGGPTTCSYRVVSEGLRWLLPYLTKRKVVVSDDEFKNLLQTKDPFFHTFELKTRETLGTMEIGPLVFVLSSDSKLFPGYAVSGWRGKVSVHLQVAKKELQAIRKLVLNEDATPSKFSKEEEKSETKTEIKTEVKSEDKMEQ